MTSRSLSVDEIVQLGKQFYAQKSYEPALSQFTLALQRQGPTLNLLDYAAAAAEKAGNFSISIAHGKCMIQLDETNARGYLRLTRTLEGDTKGDYSSKALALYKRGLLKVPDSDPNIKLLRAARNKLHRRLYPSQQLDPFVILPRELVCMILDYLPFYEVVKCIRVSRSWNGFIKSNPNLWTDLDYHRPDLSRQKPISAGFVKSCIRNSKSNIKSAIFKRCCDAQTFRVLVKSCKALEKLSIFQTEMAGETLVQAIQLAANLKILHLHPVVSVDRAHHIIRSSRTLECVHFYEVYSNGTITRALQFKSPVLKELKIWYSPTFAALGQHHPFSVVDFQFAPSLEILEFRYMSFIETVDFSLLSKLQSLHLRLVEFTRDQILPPSLRNLHMENVVGMLDAQHELPLLEELFLQGRCRDILPTLSTSTNGSDAPFILTTPQLKKLTLIPRIVEDSIPRITDSLPSPLELEHLVLYRIINPEAMFSSSIAKCNGLRSLEFVECDGITGVDIKEIVTALPLLQILRLYNCLNVSSDVVDWAKRKGIYATHRIQTEPRKAR